MPASGIIVDRSARSILIHLNAVYFVVCSRGLELSPSAHSLLLLFCLPYSNIRRSFVVLLILLLLLLLAPSLFVSAILLSSSSSLAVAIFAAALSYQPPSVCRHFLSHFPVFIAGFADFVVLALSARLFRVISALDIRSLSRRSLETRSLLRLLDHLAVLARYINFSETLSRKHYSRASVPRRLFAYRCVKIEITLEPLRRIRVIGAQVRRAEAGC